MKINDIIKERVEVKKIDWNSDPDIGWFLETDPCRIYYGTDINDVETILEKGIFADDDGYVKCAMEPHTAHYHATPLTESVDDNVRVIFVVDIPQDFSTANPLYTEFDKEKDLYENWGKSDVEFYALTDIYVPKHIPAKFIKGYMIKNDC